MKKLMTLFPKIYTRILRSSVCLFSILTILLASLNAAGYVEEPDIAPGIGDQIQGINGSDVCRLRDSVPDCNILKISWDDKTTYFQIKITLEAAPIVEWGTVPTEPDNNWAVFQMGINLDGSAFMSNHFNDADINITFLNSETLIGFNDGDPYLSELNINYSYDGNVVTLEFDQSLMVNFTTILDSDLWNIAAIRS